MTLTRRQTLALLSASLFAPLPAAAAVGADMVTRAQRWQQMLTEPQRAAAMHGFSDRLRLSWTFMHGARVPPGLTLERMTPEQKDAALDVLATGLSPEGLQTAQNIMLQQDILRDEWNKGSPDRNSERFGLMIFGTPGQGAWGWRFEGHHLSISYTLVGEQVVSVTPFSFSSEPNTVPSAPYKDLEVTSYDAQGRQLIQHLLAQARTTAVLNAKAPGNIIANAGRMGRVGAPAGLALGDMPAPQAELFAQLVETVALAPLPPALAEARRARLAALDPAATRFGWAGDPARGPVYFRLHGPQMLFEFATLRNQPEHHHAILHDPDENFGAHQL
ncbi:MAG: DUF3500 domain-containing protein [Pseudomonadota bacterium]